MNTSIRAAQYSYLSAIEVGRQLGISKAYAYRIIKQLNGELEGKGYLTIAGKVSRKYFSERVYGGIIKDE